MNEIGTSVREREIYKVTLVGSLVNILLVVCKFAAGFGGKSAAMIADAVHSLSDLDCHRVCAYFQQTGR